MSRHETIVIPFRTESSAAPSHDRSELAMSLEGTTVAIVGRLDLLPRSRLVRELQRRNARLGRHLSTRTSTLAIAHGAVTLLSGDRFSTLIDRADRYRTMVVSEHALLRRLGLMPALTPEPRTMNLAELAVLAGLPIATARLLVLFDLIDVDQGNHGFRDLKAARDLARLFKRGAGLASTIESALAWRRRFGFMHHLAEIGFGGDPFPAQSALSFGDPGEDVDTLWAAAEAAEAEHDFMAAARAYRRFLSIVPGDAVCHFNLANALVELGQPEDARVHLLQALSIRPDFAEAWFNLSHIVEGDTSRRYLEQAVASDPNYVDAIHDLALAYTESGAYSRAIPLWEQYLVLDPNSAWSPTARHLLRKAKQALLQDWSPARRKDRPS